MNPIIYLLTSPPLPFLLLSSPPAPSENGGGQSSNEREGGGRRQLPPPRTVGGGTQMVQKRRGSSLLLKAWLHPSSQADPAPLTTHLQPGLVGRRWATRPFTGTISLPLSALGPCQEARAATITKRNAYTHTNTHTQMFAGNQDEKARRDVKCSVDGANGSDVSTENR